MFLLPDLSMIGYSLNDRIGKIAYNLGHTYIFSGILLFIGWLNHWDFVQQIGLIWIAHIAMDRMIGFGLKYDTFKDTYYIGCECKIIVQRSNSGQDYMVVAAVVCI
ncbi:uncharacterized protein DUF4260 [Baia soyae]|uniref:Uncharacterized protein DUF4260 n=1 Tax=Baia soyae TaxID=1544746 RepID=A0A4R2RJJ9_9BACL|nr:DUF4260 family protein [Baia soyae]TCP64022.1 uncharacterized protein DUF4260 [Baia soyae]